MPEQDVSASQRGRSYPDDRDYARLWQIVTTGWTFPKTGTYRLTARVAGR